MKKSLSFALSLVLIFVVLSCNQNIFYPGSSGSSDSSSTQEDGTDTPGDGTDTPGGTDTNPPAPVIKNVVDQDFFKTTPSLEWDSHEKSTDTAQLSFNNGVPFEITAGYSPADSGDYTLTVYRTLKANSEYKSQTSVSFTLDTSTPAQTVSTNVGGTGDVLEIDFRPSGTMGNAVYAFWIEDMQGNFIQNLFVCNVPATNVMKFNGAFVCRPEALPYWMHKAGKPNPYEGAATIPTKYEAGIYLAYPSSEAGDPVPADLDEVTQATIYNDFLMNTKRRNDGLTRFRVLFEINKSFDGNDYYTNTFSTDVYYDDSQPSVVYAVDIDTSSAKKHYLMNIVGAGHYAGRDGELHSTEHHTTALELVNRIVVTVK